MALTLADDTSQLVLWFVMTPRTRPYRQNISIEFDFTLESTNQISHVTNFSESDWSIFRRRVKFYAGIFYRIGIWFAIALRTSLAWLF